MSLTHDLTGRTALVTGASQGIGFATAMALAEAGASTAILARRYDLLLEAKEKLAARTTAEIVAIPGDVGEDSCPEMAIQQVEDELGRVDILVNNAGGPPAKEFMKTTASDWNHALTQNLLSMIRFCQAAVPRMKEQGWGRIINIASTSAKEPLRGMVLSNAARAAVIAVSKTMALELSCCGITTNTICPGPTHTDRAEELIKGRVEKESMSYEEVVASIVSNVPVGRMAEPAEIASAAAFLASDAAQYVSGVVLAVDGGLTRSLY